jgi:hypothetical protein
MEDGDDVYGLLDENPTQSLTPTQSELETNAEHSADSDQLVYSSEPYEPPESLWQLIKSVANERELDVIKSIIGASLVETSIDLHNEIDSLLEIWRDYRNETMVSLNQIKQSINSKTNLPEPPNIRETLKKEIRFFVKQMREQFKEEDKFCRQIVANNHNLNVINYVLNSASQSNEAIFDLNETSSASATPSKPSQKRSSSLVIERPMTALSKQTGNETPLVVSSSRASTKTGEGRQSRQRIRYRSGSRSSSANSARTITSARHTFACDEASQIPATLSENLEGVVDEDKLNCAHIDEIAEHLRELLQEECDALLKDTEFLYECIDRENEYRAKSRLNLREPSLNELKEERKKLEADLLSSTGKNQIQISKLPASVSVNSNNRSIRSPVLTSRISPSPPPSAISKTTKLISPNLAASKKPVVKASPVVKRSSSLVPASNPTRSSGYGKVSAKSKENGLSRPDSVSSVASSVASSVSSTNSKQSAVQKFRQMVLESRD